MIGPQPVPVVTFKINDQDVSARADETVLDAANDADIYIPTLCNLEGLTPWGGCRLCLVEVRGTTRLLPACVTRPQEGMEVFTDTPRLQKYRRLIIELLFSERNHVCSVCVYNGRCELQAMAQRLGMTHIDIPYRYPRLPVDASHEMFRMDHNRCILCTRCVRVCDEIEGAHTWDVMGRGIDCRVITDLNQPWGQAQSCTRCGKCVECCPTGALTHKGTAVAEVIKEVQFLPYLTLMRKRRQHG